jgi:TPP-dependent pyruvate/acetoin dehydrogenase alpha subunit
MELRCAATGSRGTIAPTQCDPSTSFSSHTLRRHSARPLAKDTPRHICKATDPSLMQDVLMGGAVVGAVGAALANGLKSEPEVCESCAGSGDV